ncbi:MerR family transcriptional regulator [Paenibacillus faecalis]|uniref:MerR family transcriptional regulator n=1 Tax=Paenibacillus faecalis TaxID=2079532 RepID=UPI000D1045C1|nr:MerR family transcriptional regulator [Paenibacillus faecalis]
MYRTTEIAKEANVHPNTVRVYEKWGYISPVPRADNGYRMFSDVHLFQLRVARCAFRCEIVQGHIREKARDIVKACGEEHFSLALQLAEHYLTHLKQEHAQALEAIELVEKWLGGTESEFVDESYTRVEAANLLKVSAETIRNWERNGLITVPRRDDGHRIYSEKEINRLKIIRTLRAAHYSISAILRLLKQAEKSKELNVKRVLNTPETDDDIITVTDCLIHSLDEAIQSAKEVIQLLITREE